MKSKEKRVLVTGGGTFLGDSIAAALLAEGADVTLLVRPEAEEKLGPHREMITRSIVSQIALPSRTQG